MKNDDPPNYLSWPSSGNAQKFFVSLGWGGREI